MRYKIIETVVGPNVFLRAGEIVDELPLGVSPTVAIELAVEKTLETATKKRTYKRKKKGAASNKELD